MPSLINELAVAELSEIAGRHPSLMLVDPAGLKASESLWLRRQLSDAGAVMRQGKARLVCRAVGEDLAAHCPADGSLAIVAAEDIAAVAKILDELVKNEKVAVRAGRVEGRAVDARTAARFADLPTKHEARALLARALRAPVVRLARLAKAPYRRLGRALQAHRDKQEEAS